MDSREQRNHRDAAHRHRSEQETQAPHHMNLSAVQDATSVSSRQTGERPSGASRATGVGISASALQRSAHSRPLSSSRGGRNIPEEERRRSSQRQNEAVPVAATSPITVIPGEPVFDQPAGTAATPDIRYVRSNSGLRAFTLQKREDTIRDLHGDYSTDANTGTNASASASTSAPEEQNLPGAFAENLPGAFAVPGTLGSNRVTYDSRRCSTFLVANAISSDALPLALPPCPPPFTGTSGEAAPPKSERKNRIKIGVSLMALLLVVIALSITLGVASKSWSKPWFAAGVDYKAVSRDIVLTHKSNPECGPAYVRLAWHSSGTYTKMTQSGGSQRGTIRFKEELAYKNNAGLEGIIQWLEPIYAKYADAGLTYADLFTLAGVTAIKEMGGPTIPWSAGRVDSMDLAAPDGLLPNADSGPPGADKSDADHIRHIFHRMGFNDQEAVALIGAHALGKCHSSISGYDGPWTPAPTTFNNSFFLLLKTIKWTRRDWNGLFQYENGKGGSLMMLPTDIVLIQDESFAKYVDLYASDGQKFEKDFAAAYQKLLENGTSGLTPVEWA